MCFETAHNSAYYKFRKQSKLGAFNASPSSLDTLRIESKDITPPYQHLAISENASSMEPGLTEPQTEEFEFEIGGLKNNLTIIYVNENEITADPLLSMQDG